MTKYTGRVRVWKLLGRRGRVPRRFAVIEGLESGMPNEMTRRLASL